MPTYQYRCADCGEELEIKQSFSDAALTECPACGGSLRKVFGAAGVVFKGSGFYRNDSRSSAKSASGSAKGSSDAAASTSTSGTSGSGSSGSTSGSASTSGSSTSGSSSTSGTGGSGAA